MILISAENTRLQIWGDFNLLCLANVGWSDISLEFVTELFSRNVRWLLQKEPSLGNIEQVDRHTVGRYRLDKTFKHTIVSRRLVTFQVNFLERVGRQEGKSQQVILKSYNKSLGNPNKTIKRNLQKSCKEILHNDKNWNTFFDRIYINPPSERTLSRLLVDAVTDSEKQRYHSRYRTSHQYQGAARRY
eukprot:TRINITY_DN14785_c0_g1_i1.p1 TRINITY_DN14785_c0_g1~~TRINITY_DN14785_c0_g1_i1.p1  ORF type:complete len:188 (+),score=17.26 TRINITY_DN14785_c0_g1_i1:307-870(+)